MTRLIFISIFYICCLSTKSFCQEKDSIILYNGQVLIGEVQGASLGTMSIDDIDMKIQNIKLYKIRILKIQHRFKIETVDKKFYYGTLKTTDKEGWVNIHTIEGGNIEIHITKIYHLISLDKDILKRLNGTISAGLSFTKSSDIGQVNFSANVQFATKHVGYMLAVSSIGSIDSGRYSRDNENVQLYASYDLTTVWYIAGVAQYQRNLELNIARRFLGMVGPGYKIFIEKNYRLLANTGMSFSQEKSTEGVESGILYEIPVMFQFNYYKGHNPDIQISSTQAVYFSLSQAGRIRYDGNTSFSWQLIRYFYLNINPYSNYDSKPPAGSGSNFDYGIVVGLSYKF
jgi:hypothetical protein